MKDPVGLIGIGLVGTALAEHLLKADYPVVGFDIVPDKCRSLERMGGKAVSSPCQVAREVDRVFLSLMNTDIVREVVTGHDGVLLSLISREPSSIPPQGTLRKRARLADLLRLQGDLLSRCAHLRIERSDSKTRGRGHGRRRSEGL